MTVVQPNSIAGINSISVQSGQSLSIHKSDGTLIREIVASTGISTFSSISVGSAATANNAGKSINIGLGASISQHSDNTLSFGTNGIVRARIDSSGNFGIGTNNPSKPLTIEGTAHTDGILIHAGGNHSTAIDMDSNRSSAAGGLAELNFKWNGTTVGRIGAYAGADTTNKDDGHIHFGTASAGSIVERLRITSAGLIGIGTAAPGQTLHLSAASGDVYNRVDTNVNGGMLLYVQGTQRSVFANDSAFSGTSTDTGIGAKGNLILRTGTSSYDERLRISSSGLVGINTNAPTALLSFGVQRSVQTYPPICFQAAHASGIADAAISTTDDSGGVDIMMGANVYMGQNGTFTRYFSSYGSAAVRCGYTGNTIFYNKSGNNAPAEAMRIDGSGRLLIGSAANSHNGGDLLQLSAASSTASIQLNRYTANEHPSYINFFKSRNGSISGQTVVQDDDTLGLLAFYGSDGTDRALGAEVCAQVDGTPGSDDMPGRLVFRTSADGSQSPTERLRITSNGEVLIGHTAVIGHNGIDGYLQVTGTGTDSSSINLNRFSADNWCPFLTMGKSRNGTKGSHTVVSANDYLGYINFAGSDGTDFNNTAAYIACQVDDNAGTDDVPGRLIFATCPDGTNAAVERLRIQNDGAIGINQTNPNKAKLHVVGPSSATDEIIAKFKGGSGSDCKARIGLVAGYSDTSNDLEGHAFIGALRNGSGNQAHMVFETYNGTAVGERIRISSTGRTYINTTTPIDGNSTVAIRGGFGSAGCGVEIKHAGNPSSNRDFIRFYNTSDGEAGSIEHNAADSVAYLTSSDYRLKENIADITDGIERLKLLKPRKFSWIEDPELGLRDGFIAHEVSPVIPHCISGEKDAVKEDGSIQTQTMEYSQLTPLLTAALQEAIAEIETLKAKVAALESA